MRRKTYGTVKTYQITYHITFTDILAFEAGCESEARAKFWQLAADGELDSVNDGYNDGYVIDSIDSVEEEE
jgi:hypothetical protein